MKIRSTDVPHGRRRIFAVAAIAGLLLLATSCGLADGEQATMQAALDDGDIEVRYQQLSGACSVDVQGHGSVDLENDYLPSVVACENGNAPMEALKAQAVAARTFAQFIIEDEQRVLIPTTSDQVYGCGAAITDEHRQAVQETAGEVLVHGDRLSVGFYVAGAIPPSGQGCHGDGGSDPTNTEHHVTYNEDKAGPGITPATRPMGNPNHPSNRGVKSQNGASCLDEEMGWDYERILRFYYGDDIRVRVADSGECADVAPDGGQAAPAPEPPEGQMCMFSEAGDQSSSSCTDSSQDPQILPRSAWNAEPATQSRRPHSPNRITVHHTVTANNADNGAQQVKHVQNIHKNRGWRDIGYHFLISWDGTIYTGAPRDRIGAHAGGDNTGNLGIALLGTFHEDVAPSDAQLESLPRLVDHLSDEFDIDLQRSNVQGHGEWPTQSTLCPGHHVADQLDESVDAARGDAVCEISEQEPSEQEGGGEEVDGYKYIRITGVDVEPTGGDDVVDGFEVDSVFARCGGEVVQASNVLCSPGVSNPEHAVGEPENDTCDNRADTVAGVPEGGELILEFGTPIKVGDTIKLVQHAYDLSGSEDCKPTGTAKVSVSIDGKAWKVLDTAAQGNTTYHLGPDDFVFDEHDDRGTPGAEFEFVVPEAGEAHSPDVTFQTRTNHPDIVEVEYYVPAGVEEVIDRELGSSIDANSNYRASHTFQHYGERRVAARGLDGAGNEVASQEIVITVTDPNGVIPEGEDESDPLPDGSNIDTAMAAIIAEEGGRCYDPQSGEPRCEGGSNGSSLGLSWRFVKRALDRAGVNWARLGPVGPCSNYRFQLSSFGFRCNADPNPDTLASIGLERIDVPTTEAPAGAIIAWDQGCQGFNREHGHIQISQGDGTACSDFCGDIRDDASCASVYVPVN